MSEQPPFVPSPQVTLPSTPWIDFDYNTADLPVGSVPFQSVVMLSSGVGVFGGYVESEFRIELDSAGRRYIRASSVLMTQERYLGWAESTLMTLTRVPSAYKPVGAAKSEAMSQNPAALTTNIRRHADGIDAWVGSQPAAFHPASAPYDQWVVWTVQLKADGSAKAFRDGELIVDTSVSPYLGAELAVVLPAGDHYRSFLWRTVLTESTVKSTAATLKAAYLSTTATLEWDPPPHDGGEPILGYAVRVFEPGGGVTETLTPADATTFTLTATIGSSVQVSAVNAIGKSSPVEVTL